MGFLDLKSDFQIREGELKEIPDTLLLFLRRLCKIGVKIEPSGFRLLFKREQTGPNGRITLVKEAGDVVRKRIYHVEGAELENLPEHGDQSAQTTAEVILAFPVDDSHRPIIEQQHVYSFLPMRQEGFKFLIQSDFITTANRQGVHLYPRNYTIRERISLVFIQAVYNFCKNATLKYEWLQHLPGPSIPDPFWATLREIVLESLSESKILLTRNGALDCPKSLQHPSSRHCDRHGQPLLDDITPEIYMSEGYNWSRHSELLTELGVTNLSFKNILDRLDPYLVGSTPRLFDVSLDDDWHARLAGLLLRGLSMYGARIRERVENDLTLKTVDVKISQDTPRWKLFEALGVSSCSSQKVVNSILRRYDPPVGVTLRHSIDHLKYLFWVGSGKILDKRIFVMDQMERRVYRGFVMFGVHIIRDDVYFATDGEYSTKKLSQKLRCRSNQQNSFPVEIYIIHDACLGALPPSACSHGLTWERWLQVTANVRRVPKLFDPFQDRLFPLGQHFSDHHPTTVIGILKTYWSNYNREMTSNIIRVLEWQLWVGPESCVWAETPIIGGNIHSMCPKARDIEDLRDLQLLPVQMPNGNIEILRPVDTFFFSDTLEYQSTFHGKAPLLKISLEEHRKLYRVLEALGLEDRYISTIVEERVVVEQMEPEPSRQETRFFQRKAKKHLYHCALHYNPEIEDNKVPNLQTAFEVSSILGSENFELGLRSRQPSYQVETAGAFVTSRQASARSIRPFTVPASPLALPDYGAEPVPPVTQFVQLLCNVIRLGRQATPPEASQVLENASNGTGIPPPDGPLGFSSFFKHSIFPASAAIIGRALSAEKSLFIQTPKTLPLGNGSETADLVFDDSSSALTSLLIRAGYLPPDSWRGARPTYYIEVKTTTGEITPGSLMRVEVAGEPNDEIYMIFRVYHLDKESIGVQIYLDPESLRQEERFIFTAESYSVVPGQL
ncbi:predicted protein [Histoplasma mississippiense (nom. inval.)]|uniref:predicted protein n=1 Tax=Ajellomyces capsulatus (strain NAm1 / WU24) TaxID=2059318 RepID=UPI000157B5E8|nr:predicted protein [Histoplasma mississippiense (nom. inval.)]EDN02425.1 predicted protein [Histoplasma mississippiense (nom. inval.)]